MKLITILILSGALTATVVLAAEPPGGTPEGAAKASVSNTDTNNAADKVVTLPSTAPTNASEEATASLASASATNAAPATGENPDLAAMMPEDNGTNGLRLNFRGASLDQVLNYLSEAAGFIIVLETQPKGKVDVFSSQPLTKEEAVNLLNSVLRKNGYAAIRNGRTLTIVNRDEAKTHDIPVILGSDPSAIPRTDEVVTQIIPVHFVEVAQLIKDLQPLVSLQTTMTANESGNSIVITDTQANVHKVAEVIKAIDSGAEDMTLVKVFRLKNADPSETADLLTSLFPDDTRSGNSAAPVQFGGFPGRMARFFGGGGGPGGGGQGGGGNNAQNARIKKRARVIAVADPRTASVVVSAAKDLMEQIENVVEDLDGSSARRQTVRVIQLQNTDPQTALPVLQDIFQKNGTQNSRNTTANQTGPLQNRSTQQLNQQNNASAANRTGMGGNRGGGIGGFGQ
jgi:type II secretory pathway component GspD/PulD (secretin)